MNFIDQHKAPKMGVLPARMIKKMAAQVLAALDILHESGRAMKGNRHSSRFITTSHRLGIRDGSFVIVYKGRQSMNEHDILKFFGQIDGFKDHVHANETGTGPLGTGFNVNSFDLKLALTGK